jgi:Polyketide cyclase / dehydrase and lipid transport
MPRAHASAVIASPIEPLWQLVRDFGNHTAWINNAVKTEMVGGSSPLEIGAVRLISFRDGSQLGERLTALDERERTLSYELTVPHEPLASLRGTMRLLPVTADGSTYMERFVDFEIADGSAPEAFRERAAGLLALSLTLVNADPRVLNIS